MTNNNLEDYQGIRQEFLRNPATLGIDQLTPYRPTIGNDVPIILWRLIRVVGLHQILGEETATTTYFAGKHIGQMLKVKTVEEFHQELIALRLGKVSFPVNTPNSIHVSFEECITCSGIKPPLGRPICQLESGIVVGALQSIFIGKKVMGRETKCIGGLGDKMCLTECSII